MNTTTIVHAADKSTGMTLDELCDAVDAAPDGSVVTVTTSWSGKIRTITFKDPE